MRENERRGAGRPNMYASGKMVMRSYRFPAQLVDEASRKAELSRKKLSQVIREFLEEYIKK